MALFGDATFWVLISFCVFLFAFFRLGRGPILARLDARIEEIRKEIGAAESLRIEAQELLAQYQRKQRDAAREAAAIIENAKTHAAQITRQAEADLAESLKRREQQVEDRLRRIRESAAAEMRAYAAELAVKATREIIADKMDDKTSARLTEDSIKQVSGHLA